MATYAEIYSLFAGGDIAPLKNKVLVALYIAANNILEEATPDATRLAWAQAALQNPDTMSKAVLRLVVADSNSAPIATILAATDTQIQTKVGEAVNKLADLAAG